MTKYEKVSELPGVGEATMEKLAGAGLDTILSLAVSNVATIAELTGMSEAKARALIKTCRDSMNIGFINAVDENKRQDSVLRIPSGSKKLDELLNGGFICGLVSEAYGHFGSAKSQIGHQLCVNIQKINPDYKAIYIDTENAFRTKRIIEMATGQGLDPDKVLNNIKLAKTFNSDHQILTIEQVEQAIKNDPTIKLLVVDSIISHFRIDYQGRGQLADRQQKLNKHVNTLVRLAMLYDICVFFTNQVMSDPGQSYGDPTRPVGGHVLSHAARYILHLRKSKAGITAKLVDAPDLPDGEVIFQVTQNGIED